MPASGNRERPRGAVCLMHFTRYLRLWLVLATLVCAQSVVLTHALEHLDADETAVHSCAVCLAGQNIDTPGLLPAAFPPVAADLPLQFAAAGVTPALLGHFFALPPARAPPHS